MRIGIMTFWSSNDNYGQLLQCYALQRFLIKNDHEPTLIRYKESIETGQKHSVSISKIFNYIVNFKQYYTYLKEILNRKEYEQNNCNEKRDFDGFRNKYISSTRIIYNEDSLAFVNSQFDAYICGSDQIWGGRKEYYLSFVPQDKIKIAYAPSFGGVNPFINSESNDIIHYLKDFDFLSTRENSGVEILREAGFDSVRQVVDPTLLLSATDYIELIKNEGNSIRHFSDAFLYFLGNSIACNVKDIVSFLEKNNLTYTYVASQGRNDKFSKSYLTIPQWIDSIRHAKLVITNSFHCVVFSLILHRPFLFIPLAAGYGRMNDRLIDILKKCNLLDRIFNGDFSKVLEPIDFECFDTRYSKEIEMSKSWLIEALKN